MEIPAAAVGNPLDALGQGPSKYGEQFEQIRQTDFKPRFKPGLFRLTEKVLTFIVLTATVDLSDYWCNICFLDFLTIWVSIKECYYADYFIYHFSDNTLNL